ncbi:RISC-loading complex subunit tarbp2-like [Osmia bicornis bicornis]|uniref:RISC-loading complex subunit tarbp2-like n=1 Tax=Osmia bicornis bicornis TaxID=1437191 RepID=UPI001EAF401D|nr:RISC-loading complex subunit tarbp2-like [Osmia bicornis bicornis]
MNKTPIMVLQDASVKLGTLPVYTEISSVSSTHQNKFVIRVAWRNYTAEGTAYNKKEAKQNAATKMISLLLLEKEIPETLLLSVVKPTGSITLPKESNTSTTIDYLYSSITNNSNVSDKEEFMNYVGLLNEHCQQNNFPNPIYDNIAIAGPSHIPMFTISCTVGSVCQKGCARTKKIAKQEAAKQVLENLQSHLPPVIKHNTKTSDTMNDLNVQFMELSTDQPKYENFNKEKVLEAYGRTRQIPVLFKPHIKVEDYVKVLSNLCHSLDVTNQNCLKNVCNTLGLQNVNTLKAIIHKAFETNVEEVNFKTVDGKSAIGLKLNTNPIICQIGIGVTKEEARKNALCKLLEFVLLFQK